MKMPLRFACDELSVHTTKNAGATFRRCAGAVTVVGCIFAWIAGNALVTASASAQPFVQVVADLIETFPTARTNDCLECAPRPSASAGGAKREAIFEHPLSGRKPARIDYQLALPAVTNGESLLLSFDIALSDGIKLSPAVDGVRFGVELDGRRVFTRDVRETRWEPYALDLTPAAGPTARIGLLTEAIGNTAFDWALWGQPRLLRIPAGTLAGLKASGPFRVPVSVGVVVVRRPPNGSARMRLKADAGVGSLEIVIPAYETNDPAGVWLVKEFQFRGATSIELDWEPLNTLKPEAVRVAAHQPRLKLQQFGPARAVNFSGVPLPLRAVVLNRGPGRLAAGQAHLEAQAAGQSLASKSIPALGPGESFRAEWVADVGARSTRAPLEARLNLDGDVERRTNAVNLLVPRRLTPLIENEQLALAGSRQSRGYAFLDLSAREGSEWMPVAILSPLFRAVLETRTGDREWLPLLSSLRRITPPGGEPPVAELRGQARDPDGVLWQLLLRTTLETNGVALRLHYEWKAGRDRRLRGLWGPNVYVGDNSTGEAKSWGLFPGLEYLFGPEQSSNPRDFAPNLADRRTPDPKKITIPLLAVTIGPDSAVAPANPGRLFTPDSLKDRSTLRPHAISNFQSSVFSSSTPRTIALHWDPLQKWDGEHAFPSARFASPNFDEGMANHRLGLFLPSTPDFVSENSDSAARSYELPAGKVLTLDATLTVTRGPVLTALKAWLDSAGGLPARSPWPRTFQQELDLCRTGFLQTVWDTNSGKWRHCIELEPSHVPGFATLLWLDAKIAANPEARRRSRERVEQVATTMIRDGGPAQFTSRANCHIMQWEFPFLYGYLPDAMEAIEGQVQSLIQSQRSDGGWLYQSGSGLSADLGQPGDSVLGTCANRAMTLLRYARITGDTNALAAGEKALRFMESFRVPRGGQTWECPMYEPDILAAAYAVRTYHDAWRATGNSRWLHNAVYWAESGVPFNYLWTLPDKPMMLGASIPVFGSTFYTHTWLGVPVQWCGLVYAYHVWHLAQDLDRTSLLESDSPLPLALNFSAADWKRLVELLTVSAMHQQESSGPRIGTYPDSISNFERKNPLFINPEDILVNVLALNGVNPDVKTARVTSAGRETIISSGATITNATVDGRMTSFQLSLFAGEPSHTLVATTRPREVRVDGKTLTESATPLKREPGWWWEARHGRLYLTVPHASDKPVTVEIAR